MGADDYIADLDAMNLTVLLNNSDKPYAEVVTDYYAGIDNDSINRADEFVNNAGNYYAKNNEEYYTTEEDGTLTRTDKEYDPYKLGVEYIDKLTEESAYITTEENENTKIGLAKILNTPEEINMARCFKENLYSGNKEMEITKEDWMSNPDIYQVYEYPNKK